MKQFHDNYLLNVFLRLENIFQHSGIISRFQTLVVFTNIYRRFTTDEFHLHQYGNESGKERGWVGRVMKYYSFIWVIVGIDDFDQFHRILVWRVTNYYDLCKIKKKNLKNRLTFNTNYCIINSITLWSHTMGETSKNNSICVIAQYWIFLVTIRTLHNHYIIHADYVSCIPSSSSPYILASLFFKLVFQTCLGLLL